MLKKVQMRILMFIAVMMCFWLPAPAVCVQAGTSAKSIAHRGYAKSGVAPNSLRAFKEAGKEENKYWGIESDLCSTKDGKLIMLHDKTLNKMVKISESDANFGKSINSLDYSAIKNYHLVDMDKKETTDKIPTFNEYLQACKDSGKTAVIELKHIEAKYYDAAIKAIADNGMTGKTVFIGDASVLAAIGAKKGAKNIPKLAIAHSAVSDADINYMVANGITGIDFKYDLVTEESVKKAKDSGLKVGVWTVETNNVDECATAIAAGDMDYITGNSPDLIKKAKDKAKDKKEEKKDNNKQSTAPEGNKKGSGKGNKSESGSSSSSSAGTESEKSEGARGMAQRFINLMFYIFYVIGFFFIVLGVGHFFMGAVSGNTESRNRGIFMMAAGLVLLLTPPALATLNIMDLA
jgi:glycerophosphoryl diester phosphodiesterase